MRRRKRNENTEVTKRIAERTKDNEGVNRGNAYIARYRKGRRCKKYGERRINGGYITKGEKRKKKRDRHFKKTDLFIHQWTIKLIACHHANGRDPARFSTPLATKTISTFSLFPYALFSRVCESFKSFPERKNIKKFVPNVCRRAS